MISSAARRFPSWVLPAVVAGGVFFCLAWFTYSWSGFWNTNEYSRVFLVRALGDRASLSIDAEITCHYTQDNSFRDGHFYANKAPGLSFLALPVYLLIRQGEGLTGLVLAEPGLLYVLKVITVAFPSALFLLFLVFYWRRREVGMPLALGLAVALGLGSLAFPYATLFYGHYPVGILLFLSFVVIDKPGLVPAFWAGALAGLAVLVEYPALPAALLLLGYRFFLPRRFPGSVLYLVGLVPFLILLGFYHQVCFGGFFSVPYLHETYQPFYQAHLQGVVGITLPTWDTVWGLTFSSYRGIFFYFPWLIISIWALGAMIFSRSWRPTGLLFAGITLAYFYLTSAFSDWEGGWSMGARHLTPLMPFWATAIALTLSRLTRAGRRRAALIISPLALAAVINSIMAVFTFPYFPRAFVAPLQDLVYKLWSWGMFAPSWGEILGLEEIWGVFPALALVVFLATIMLLKFGEYGGWALRGRVFLSIWGVLVAVTINLAVYTWQEAERADQPAYIQKIQQSELRRVKYFMVGPESAPKLDRGGRIQ